MLVKIKWYSFNNHWDYNINNLGNCDNVDDVVLVRKTDI